MAGTKTSVPLPASRGRQGAPKGRNGCVSCKASHVRCFEDKPQCRRCVRLALRCVYSKAPLNPKTQRGQAITVYTHIRPNLSIHHSTLDGPGSHEADYYFYRFRVRVAPVTNLETLGICSGFWLKTVPRESTVNEGVRYFAIAIAALDLAVRQLEKHQQPGSPVVTLQSIWSTEYKDALSFYNVAIKHFRTEVADQKHPIQPRTFLIYCMLQSLFEGMQGNLDGYRTAAHTGFEVLKHRIMQDHVPISAPTDDEGIEEAKVALSRRVAVGNLMGASRNELQRARISISVPIRVPIPDGDSSAVKTCLVFNDFYSRAIIWVLEVGRSMAAGEGDIVHFSREITVVISQMREWAAALRDRAIAAPDPTDIIRLNVNQVDARFGVVFLLCFLHRCSWETYTTDCLNILQIARSTVQTVIGGDESRNRVHQGLLSEKLMPLLVRLVERCRDQEVRRQGEELMVMITGLSDYKMSQLSSLMIAEGAPGGIEGKANQDGEFKPILNYTLLGYTWDAERNLYKIKLGSSGGATDGVSVQRIATA